MQKFFWFCIFTPLFFFNLANSQSITADVKNTTTNSNDTLIYPTDSIDYQNNEWKMSESYKAKNIGLYSAILPGLGQFKNKQYWKIPIIAVGLATAVYSFKYNYSKYQEYRIAYLYRIDGDPNTLDEFDGLLSTDYLKANRDLFRQGLDYTVLFAFAGYMLNILDAVVASHLKSFSVSPVISISLPKKMTSEYSSSPINLSLSYHIKSKNTNENSTRRVW